MARIVIFGNNPIGLAHALALKLKDIHAEVVVYGKREDGDFQLNADALSTWATEGNIPVDELRSLNKISTSPPLVTIGNKELRQQAASANVIIKDGALGNYAFKKVSTLPEKKLKKGIVYINQANQLVYLNGDDELKRGRVSGEVNAEALASIHDVKAIVESTKPDLVICADDVANQAFFGDNTVTVRASRALLMNHARSVGTRFKKTPVLLAGKAALSVNDDTVSESFKYAAVMLNALPEDIATLRDKKPFATVKQNMNAFVERTKKHVKQLHMMTTRDFLHLHPYRDEKDLKQNVARFGSFARMGEIWRARTLTKVFKQTVKVGSNFFKPYKSDYDRSRDKWQFVDGLMAIVISPFMMLHGLFTARPTRLVQGVMTLVKGVLQVASTPFLVAKIPFRAGRSWYYAKTHDGKGPLLRNNPGMKRLAERGLACLEQTEDTPGSSLDILKTIMGDIVRKEAKGYLRGQQFGVSDNYTREVDPVLKGQNTDISVCRKILKQQFMFFAGQVDSPLIDPSDTPAPAAQV